MASHPNKKRSYCKVCQGIVHYTGHSLMFTTLLQIKTSYMQETCHCSIALDSIVFPWFSIPCWDLCLLSFVYGCKICLHGSMCYFQHLLAHCTSACMRSHKRCIAHIYHRSAVLLYVYVLRVCCCHLRTQIIKKSNVSSRRIYQQNYSQKITLDIATT